MNVLHTVLSTGWRYGMATISRRLKIIGLFCKRALQKRRYSAKETYIFKEPTNQSHHMYACIYGNDPFSIGQKDPLFSLLLYLRIHTCMLPVDVCVHGCIIEYALY